AVGAAAGGHFLLGQAPESGSGGAEHLFHGLGGGGVETLMAGLLALEARRIFLVAVHGADLLFVEMGHKSALCLCSYLIRGGGGNQCPKPCEILAFAREREMVHYRIGNAPCSV